MMGIFVSLSLALCVWGVTCFNGHNTPPSFVSRRDAIVDEDHRVGERVFVVRTVDHDGDPITFSLSPALFRDASRYFSVDPQTGEVFLKQSLDGLGGRDYYMYVKADDGHHQAKMEVSIKIVRSAHKSALERKEELDSAPSRPTAVDIQPVNVNLPTLPDLSKTHVLSSDSGSKKVPSSPVLAVLFIIISAGLVSISVSAGIYYFKPKWNRRDPKDKIKPTKSSVFDDKKAQEIALSRIPLQPSWVVALEKREPVVKSAEFFSTLTDHKWEFPRHHLRFLHILGEGCFGQVWACEALQHASDNSKENTSITVAVKTLKDNASEKEKRDFLSELSIMKLLDPHPNIVTLLGCCTEKNPLFVIMEYVRNGKLQTYLRDSRPSSDGKSAVPSLTSSELTKFAYQVARGMEYLSSKGIIHRDLAARNVLVTDTKQCKVADFGFARDVISNQVYERKSEGKLPVRWMAPESLYDNIFTTKTDVWSFGVLLWEIVTLGSTPYPGMAAVEVMRRVRDGYRLERPEHCKREICNIMAYCWDANPAQRPSFTELIHLLDKLLGSENDYIELERFPDHGYYNVCHDLPGEKL